MDESLVRDATIDCHAHIFTGSMPPARTAWTVPTSDASLEAYRQALETFGIRRAVLAASSLHDDGNRYSTDATRADPRLRTTVIVPPGTPIERLRDLDAVGACGIRLQLRNKELPDLRSASYRTLLRHVAEIGWHVELHDDSRRLPPMIDAIEESGAPLVVDHFGRPDAEGAADAGFRAVVDAVRRGRTWVKVSAAFRLEDPRQDRSLADALLAAHGPDRLLWGSDWPFVGFEARMTYQQALADYARAVPDIKVRSAIDDSAARFYFRARPDGAPPES